MWIHEGVQVGNTWKGLVCEYMEGVQSVNTWRGPDRKYMEGFQFVNTWKGSRQAIHGRRPGRQYMEGEQSVNTWMESSLWIHGRGPGRQYMEGVQSGNTWKGSRQAIHGRGPCWRQKENDAEAGNIQRGPVWTIWGGSSLWMHGVGPGRDYVEEPSLRIHRVVPVCEYMKWVLSYNCQLYMTIRQQAIHN